MVFGLDPLVFGLIVGLVAGAGLELTILWFAGRRWIPNRSAEVYNAKAAAGDLDAARDRFIAPIKAELEDLRAEIGTEGPSFKEEIESLRGEWNEFAELVSEDLEKIPQTITMTIRSIQGVEQREIQKIMVEQAGDLEATLEATENVMMADPEQAVRRALAKLMEWEPSEKWAEEHPLLHLFAQSMKPVFANQIEGMMLGTGPTITQRVGKLQGRRNLQNPYGG